MTKENFIAMIKTDFGNSLLSVDLWNNEDQVSLIGVNSNSEFYTIFMQTKNFLEKKLFEIGFPPINDFMIVNLEMDTIFLLIKLDENYSLGCLLDKSKIAFSTLTRMLVPKILKKFNNN